MGSGRAATARPTMREVAALAGVSFKTVSRVVNGEAGVGADVAARVLAAVQSLDYRHNLQASSLRRADRRTFMIGLVVTDVSNPFSSALARAVEDVAHRNGSVLISGSSDDDPRREEQLLRSFVSRWVDGVVAVPAAGLEAPPVATRVQLPRVVVDRPAAGVDNVLSDNRAGARTAVAHLAAHGHRRIVFLGDRQDIWTAGQRYEGYADALAAAELPLDPSLVCRDLVDEAAAAAALLRIIDRDEAPTAVFSAQNLLTMGCLRALHQRGLQHEVALVGFDDVAPGELLDPGVTVVAQDVNGLGRTAADLLFERVAGREDTPRVVVVPTSLVQRGSGELPPRPLQRRPAGTAAGARGAPGRARG